MTPWPFGVLAPRSYRAIVVDPPTRFVGGTKGRPQHYERMSDKQIASLPIGQLAHPKGAWLFLWVTSPKLYCKPGSGHLDPQDIAARWGFTWSGRAFVWIKTVPPSRRRCRGVICLQAEVDGITCANDEGCDQMTGVWSPPPKLHTGTGYTTRKNAEDVLLFKRGEPKRLAADVHEVIVAPAREHSRKPDEFYARVRRFCAGPYADLFAREPRQGFDVWGDEATKFAEEA